MRVLALALLTLVMACGVRVDYPGQVGCERYDYQVYECEDMYVWSPGYWETYGGWHPGRYHRRPGPRVRDHRRW